MADPGWWEGGFGRGVSEKILRPRPLSAANHAYFHAFIRASAQVVGLYELIQLLLALFTHAHALLVNALLVSTASSMQTSVNIGYEYIYIQDKGGFHGTLGTPSGSAAGILDGCVYCHQFVGVNNGHKNAIDTNSPRWCQYRPKKRYCHQLV